MSSSRVFLFVLLFLSFWRAQRQGKGDMGESGRRGRKDGKAVKTEVEGGVLRNSRRRQAKKKGEQYWIKTILDKKQYWRWRDTSYFKN